MLSVGQNLQIEPIFEQNVQDIYPFQTTIVDYNDQVETFQVERPVSEGKTDELAFKQGTLFNIVLIEEDGEVYQFESELLSIDDGEEMVYEFNLPEQFKRIQRRAYVRVDIETEIKIHLDELHETRTVNLSGGGMCVVLPAHLALNIGDQFTSHLQLMVGKTPQELSVESEVVRLETEGHEQKVFVQFVNIDEADRTKIVQFCFQEQLEEYRKQR